METPYLDTWTRDKRAGRLGFAQRAQLAAMKAAHTLISGQDPAKLALCVDISHWQGDVNVGTMARDGKTRLLLPKASDGKQVRAGDPLVIDNYVDDWLDRNIQKAYDAAIPCAPYHYVQLALPDYTATGLATWNFKTFQHALRNKTPKKSYHALVLDVEETNASNISGSDVVLKLMALIAGDPQMNQVPLIIYSSMSVLNRYTALRDQLSYQGANRNLWMAQWIWNTTTNCDWSYFWQTVVPKLDMRVLVPGYANWKMVQWSSSFILPGGSGRTDVSFYNGTPEALDAWLGYQRAAPPQPPQPPTPPPAGEYVTRAEFEAHKADYANHKHETGAPA